MCSISIKAMYLCISSWTRPMKRRRRRKEGNRKGREKNYPEMLGPGDGKVSSLLLLVIFWSLLFPVSLALGTSPPPHPVIFNFGDSNSDTGGLVAGLGFPVNLPNGRSFFRRSTGRLCDGRLVIDFLCEFLSSSFFSF